MHSSQLNLALLCVSALAAVGPALAQSAAPADRPLEIRAENLTAAREAEAGTPRSEKDVRPGDRVRYHLVFTNPTPGSIRGVKLEDPIPAGLVLVAGSADADHADAAVEYSIDGGATYQARPMIDGVVDGERRRVPAPVEQYTHVRWTVNGALAPGARVSARFDARFRANSTSAEPKL